MPWYTSDNSSSDTNSTEENTTSNQHSSKTIKEILKKSSKNLRDKINMDPKEQEKNNREIILKEKEKTKNEMENYNTIIGKLLLEVRPLLDKNKNLKEVQREIAQGIEELNILKDHIDNYSVLIQYIDEEICVEIINLIRFYKKYIDSYNTNKNCGTLESIYFREKKKSFKSCYTENNQ